MNAPNFFRLSHFIKMVQSELFNYCNLSFDQFLLHGNADKLNHAIQRIFYLCFDGSDYVLDVEMPNNIVQITIYCRCNGQIAFILSYSFDV